MRTRIRSAASRSITLLASIFFSPVLFGQQPTIESDIEDSTAAHFSPSYFSPSYLVTPQELKHRIPGAALSEMSKAEQANREHNREKEIHHLTKAVTLDPDYIWARNHLAARLIASDTAAAIAQLTEGIKIDPNQPVLFHNLALAYLYENQPEMAEAAARRARALGSRDLRTRILLGWILIVRKQYTTEALSLVKTCGDEYPVAWLIAARIFIARSNLPEAMACLQNYLSSGDTAFTALATSWLNYTVSAEHELMDPY